MKVIKLGGSLTQSGQMADCLQHIALTSTHPTVIVPGGGDFANQVRFAQHHWHFDDEAAHHMAILAMQQMAILLHSLQRDFPLVDQLSNLQQTRQTSIWFPELALLNQHAIPASWSVTSDSLAAWLAGKLNARELIVIKAATCSAAASINEFVEQGLLDTAFSTFVQPEIYSVKVISSHDFLASSRINP